MTKNAVDETIEKFQVMLHDIINLSLTNEDVIIHRNQIGLSDEHLITSPDNYEKIAQPEY